MRRITTPELAHANVCAWAVASFFIFGVHAVVCISAIVLSHYVAKHFARCALEAKRLQTEIHGLNLSAISDRRCLVAALSQRDEARAQLKR